ncbi:hypothetical protein [Nocardioides sp. LS1]|uniref:hypothetical protein n=1 Tax=Nocardioides sp. LS1 TaxID=1027620 RepID=UPI000F6223AE|nr:hypothetical protein [Nocardioides sp. LS1]
MCPSSDSQFGDDELEGLVQETLAADREVPDGWREAARAAYAWRTVDEELLALTYDSEQEPAAAVRGDEGTRTLEFSGDGLALEVELTGGRVLGQVTGAGEVVLEWADGRTASATADGSGFFSLDAALADGGPVRFCVRRGGARLVTEWVVP